MKLNRDPWFWFALFVFMVGVFICCSAFGGMFREPWKAGEQLAMFIIGGALTYAGSQIREHVAQKPKGPRP